MISFPVCLGCGILILILIVLGFISKKRHGEHKEYTRTPSVDPVEYYSMTRSRR